jgi:hypothetical protein
MQAVHVPALHRFEDVAPLTILEARASFLELWSRVKAGEPYGRPLKNHLSRLGEWFDDNSFLANTRHMD